MIATLLDSRSLSDLMAELSAAGLPASDLAEAGRRFFRFEDDVGLVGYGGIEGDGSDRLLRSLVVKADRRGRSDEHTSELQSLMRISYAVFCLKKKQNNT